MFMFSQRKTFTVVALVVAVLLVFSFHVAVADDVGHGATSKPIPIPTSSVTDSASPLNAEERLKARETVRKESGEQPSHIRQDYKSVKEDFQCRACVAIAQEFFHDVLPTAETRYRRYIDEDTDKLSGGATNGKLSSSTKGKKEKQLTKKAARRRYMDRLAGEMHDTVDGLCLKVKARHAEGVKGVAGGHLGGSKKDLQEGIEVACESTLEELNEVLTDVAFEFLAPRFNKKKAGGTAGGDSDEDGDEEKVGYTLPQAGAFCESQRLCAKYTHYHITSESDVDERIRRGRAAAGENAAEANDFSKEDREMLERELRKRKAPLKEKHDLDDRDPTMWELLFDPDLFKKIQESLPWEEILTTAYWKKFVVFAFTNDTMHFHMYPALAKAFLGVVVLVVLAAMLLCVGWCRDHRETKTESHGTKRASSSGIYKDKSASSTSASSSGSRRLERKNN